MPDVGSRPNAQWDGRTIWRGLFTNSPLFLSRLGHGGALRSMLEKKVGAITAEVSPNI